MNRTTRYLVLLGSLALASCEVPFQFKGITRITEAWNGVELYAQKVVALEDLELTSTSYCSPRGMAALVQVKNTSDTQMRWNSEVWQTSSYQGEYSYLGDESDNQDGSCFLHVRGCNFGAMSPVEESYRLNPGQSHHEIFRLPLDSKLNPYFVTSWHLEFALIRPGTKGASSYSPGWHMRKVEVGYPNPLKVVPPKIGRHPLKD